MISFLWDIVAWLLLLTLKIVWYRYSNFVEDKKGQKRTKIVRLFVSSLLGHVLPICPPLFFAPSIHWQTGKLIFSHFWGYGTFSRANSGCVLLESMEDNEVLQCPLTAIALGFMRGKLAT